MGKYKLLICSRSVLHNTEAAFGASKYVDVMKFVQARFIDTLKVKVQEANLQKV